MRALVLRFAIQLAILQFAIEGCGSAPPPRPVVKPIEQAPDPVVKPDGYVEVRVLDVIAGFGEGDTLLLVDDITNLVLPIAIGGTEGMSIEARVRNTPRRRPLTHDLLDDAVHKLGGEIVKVHVDELRDGIFFGSIYIRNSAKKIIRLDSRASDATALGIGNNVPIYVARKVLDEAGLPRDKVMPQVAPTGPMT